jgi:hypothetical protein
MFDERRAGKFYEMVSCFFIAVRTNFLGNRVDEAICCVSQTVHKYANIGAQTLAFGGLFVDGLRLEALNFSFAQF